MAELYLPDASNWINSFEAGQKAGMVDRTNKAASHAGGLMASGDYRGAAAQLYGVGDFQSGSAIAKAGYEQVNQSEKLTRQKSVQDKLAAGDISGAYAAAGTDADLLAGLGKVSEHVQETTSTMASALQALKGADGRWLPTDQARAKYAAMKPTLLARGIDPQKVEGFDPTPENLSAQEGMVLGLAEQLKMRKPDWHEVKAADGATSFKDLNPYNRQPGEATPAPAASPTAAAPTPTDGVYGQVGQFASQNGASPEEVSYLQRLAQVESSGRPDAQNGRSTGIFQFHPDTFASVGGRDIHSVPEQTYAALALSRRDRGGLQKLGLEPTDANAYIMHQQGAGGGRALLTADPGANAVKVLTPIYGNADIARKAIVNNGGTPDMSAGQFVGMWRDRWAAGGAPAKPAAGGQPIGDVAPSVAGSAAQAPEWQSDGKGMLVNHRTGDRKLDPAAGGLDVRPATAEEKAKFGIPADVPAKMKPNGDIEVVTGVAARAKQVPIKIQQGYLENKSSLQQLDHAIELLKQNPHAMGLMNAAGDEVRQRTDKGGISTRAAVANVGAVKIHDLSGAAVTAAETPRLKPFVPMPTDTAEAAIIKLEQLREQIVNSNAQIEVQYDSSNGWAPLGSEPGSAAPAAKPAGWSKALSPAQRATAMKFKQAKGPGGSEGNPFAPVSEAEFNGLPVGAWFINPADGQILQKAH